MDLDTTKALISLAEAKEYLKIGTADTSGDAVIQALLNGIGAWVSGFLRRNLVSASYTEYYDGDGGRDLVLRNSPITVLTSVHVDSLRVFGASTAVDVSTNLIVKKQQGILRCWNLYGNWPEGDANIKVIYTAGYTSTDVTGPPAVPATMPHDIRMAAKRILDHHWRTGYTHRKLDVTSESVGDITTTFRDGDVPKDAQSMLLPYRNLMPSPHFAYAD